MKGETVSRRRSFKEVDLLVGPMSTSGPRAGAACFSRASHGSCFEVD